MMHSGEFREDEFLYDDPHIQQPPTHYHHLTTLQRVTRLPLLAIENYY